ncbi:MAG TPA: hypothetical protein VN259_03035 [Xanthomonadales bacterium]|nr:hypothetical protein [Xanthomonadales bacterium]
MSKIRALACWLLTAAALAACSKSDSPASSITAAPAAATATPTADAVTGVADCDQFLSAYEQCLSEKVPEQARAQLKTGIDQWRSAWRDMANNAATKDALPQICQQARASSKPALDAYGCSI